MVESIKTYEDSLKELLAVKKSLAFSEVSIHMSALDAKSKEAITTALAQVLSDRAREVTQVITNSQENEP